MHGFNGPPIGNHICRVKWLRDRWRHVTPKGQGRDPIIFEMLYVCNGAMTSRDPTRSNSWPQNLWSPVSPYTWKIDAWFQWTANRKPHMPSLMVTWPMTSRDPKRPSSWPRNFLSPVSPDVYKIDLLSSLTTNRKVCSRRVLRLRSDDVNWHLKLKIVTPKYLRFSVFMAV